MIWALHAARRASVKPAGADVVDATTVADGTAGFKDMFEEFMACLERVC